MVGFVPAAETVGHVTLRLEAPQCETDAGWEAERPASAAYARVVRLLQTQTAAQGALSAPAFTVCWQLVRHVLETASGDEELMLQGLKVRHLHQSGMWWCQCRRRQYSRWGHCMLG